MNDKKKFLIIAIVFLIAYFIPLQWLPVEGSRLVLALGESLAMLNDYAREHVLLCLVPAFFIAGAISVFVSQASVMKYLGPGASKWVAYPVASVSGIILAVCSCTVLPLFAGIHKRGAGLGPAVAFLYAGPAISVLSIILTARVLGAEMGIARGVAATLFAVVIGLLMHLSFRREEMERVSRSAVIPVGPASGRKLWQDGLYFAAMVSFLVFANWGRPPEGEEGVWAAVYAVKWYLAGGSLVALGWMVWRWFVKSELKEWGSSAWTFALQIMPLLFGGVLVAGLLLGRPGHEALLPSEWVAAAVGGNSLAANFFASIAGAFMYFATLTEVPILQGLLGSGMGKGPGLALLLAGPALSLPSMLVIRSVIGTKKTVAYTVFVVILSTVAGFIYGSMF